MLRSHGDIPPSFLWGLSLPCWGISLLLFGRLSRLPRRKFGLPGHEPSQPPPCFFTVEAGRGAPPLLTRSLHSLCSRLLLGQDHTEYVAKQEGRKKAKWGNHPSAYGLTCVHPDFTSFNYLYKDKSSEHLSPHTSFYQVLIPWSYKIQLQSATPAEIIPFQPEQLPFDATLQPHVRWVMASTKSRPEKAAHVWLTSEVNQPWGYFVCGRICRVLTKISGSC